MIAPPGGEFGHPVPNHMPVMGRFGNLDLLLQMKTCQMVIVADDMLENDQLLHLASVCEKEMVEFKLVPTCFRVLLSGLHLESVGGIPVMGISRLPLHSTVNQYVKRGLDVLGALFGLLLAAPIIAFFGVDDIQRKSGIDFLSSKTTGCQWTYF